MSIAQNLKDGLAKRRKIALDGGGADKLAARHEKGMLGARERLERFFEPGTFQEFGMHAQHACHDFGMEKKQMPGDGVVTGTGYIGGRPVAAFSQDFTVGGGAVGRIHARKICDLMDYAVRMGMPVVGINDSGGARIQEGVDSLSGYGQIFNRNVMLSGVVPQIAIIAGPCAGGAAYSPALMDFLIMTRQGANMFICGPEVIRAATGECTTLEQFATADAHASISGNIHLIAETDSDALALVQRLLSYLPSNNLGDPPHDLSQPLNMAADPRVEELVPEDSKMPLSVYSVIDCLVDPGSFLEIQRDWAKSIIVGFARIQGVVAGIVANNPEVRAGTLDIDSSDKGARFIRTCNVFNIPIVSLVDVPGFMPGLAQERGGIIRHGAKMLFAYASATVPKVTVILRKAYGGAYLAMCSSDMGADHVFAWPTAEIAVMGPEGAVKVLYRREIQSAADPVEVEKKLREEYRERFASPWQAAANGMITDVIEPSQTRAVVAMALRNTMNKQVTRPPKKHGNIPL